MTTAKYGQRVQHEKVWDEAYYLDKTKPLLDMEVGLVDVKKAKGLKSPRKKLEKAKLEGLSYVNFNSTK